MTLRPLVKPARQPEPEVRRTHAKVRRRSQKAGGRWESRFARKITWREGDQIRRAAQMMDERSKKPGDRRGRLGLEALKVLKLMTEQLARSGRFDMAYKTIARLLRIARSCVVAAMARLRDAGFVFWVRRCVPTDKQGERGPQYEQTSNLYRLGLPKAGRALLDRLAGRQSKARPDEDEGAHRLAAREKAAGLRALAGSRDEPSTQSPATSDVSPELKRLLTSASPRRGLNP